MRKCCICKIYKSPDEFSWKNKTLGRKSSTCKSCHKEYRDRHYQDNKKKSIKQISERKSEIKEWFEDFKSDKFCKICGENHPAVLQFHHKEPHRKEKEVTIMVHNGLSIEKIKKEIEKCIILCANCHFKLHYEERLTKRV